MKIEKIEYDGYYPTLCYGKLIVHTDEKTFDSGFELRSGGSVRFTDEGEEIIEKGEWDVNCPENFPTELIEELKQKINNEIPKGCCGGCV